MKFLTALVVSSALLALPLVAQAGADPQTQDAVVEVKLAPLADARLDGARRELLNLAFQSASAMPLEPHIKNRSRAQEAVIEAGLELGQAKTVRTMIDEVANWRRGACLAELAYYCATHDDAARVLSLIESAAESLAQTDDDMAQGWRRDRLRTKMARALLAIGDGESAAKWSQGAIDAEIARLAAEAARTMTLEQARNYLEGIDRVVSTTLFEQVMGTLEIAADLYGMHYADAELRAAFETKIKESWKLMPIGVRLSLLAKLADGATNAGDQETALRLLDEATVMLDGYEWGQMRNHVPLIALIAEGRARAGDLDGAEGEVRRGLATFKAGQAATPDVFQARALRPLAEASMALGKPELATELYTLTVQVGLSNPNSRPRAEDLSATAASMATHSFEPSAELWGTLRGALNSLGTPW
jgi:hypothetical protein